MKPEDPPEAPATDQTARPSRPRVVVAEDDAELRRFIGTALRRDGYDVFEVKHGIDLIELLATEILYPETRPVFDLVISDVRMPGVTGLEILKGLRTSESCTPFIVMTAFGSPELHAQALALGAACAEKNRHVTE